MQQNRPSLRTYKAHVYRQFFGMSLSLKAITGKHGERYVVLKTTPYKLIWIICCAVAFILVCFPGYPLGLLPMLALPVLYIIVTPFTYFFARFVELDSDFVSYDMCEKASRSPRPSFSAYLRYVFIPSKERLMHLIEEGEYQYYHFPRRFRAYNLLLYALSYATLHFGEVLGTGVSLLMLLTIAGFYLLLAPLFLHFWHFYSIDKPYDPLSAENQESTDKLVSGISITAAVAVFVFMFIFMGFGSYESETIQIKQPQTLNQAYDYALSYTLERYDKADLIDFSIKFEGTDAVLSGEPSHWYLEFQDTPGLQPKPNTTISFYFYHDGSDIEALYRDYETIRPTLNGEFVTDSPIILAILESQLGISLDPEISSIEITPVDLSAFRVHNGEECQVEIHRGEKDIQKFIVNIVDGTVRLG